MYMLKKKENHVLKEKNRKGYNGTIENYIKMLKENNFKIELVEINLNEIGQLDLKIKAKEG